MDARSDREQALLAKIRDLSDGCVAELADFIDLLRARDVQREVAQAASVPSAQRRNDGCRLDRVYEQYVKPVEQDHLGEYVLVTPAGEMIFASSQAELVERTGHIRGTDNRLFTVGEVADAKFL